MDAGWVIGLNLMLGYMIYDVTKTALSKSQVLGLDTIAIIAVLVVVDIAMNLLFWQPKKKSTPTHEEIHTKVVGIILHMHPSWDVGAAAGLPVEIDFRDLPADQVREILQVLEAEFGLELARRQWAFGKMTDVIKYVDKRLNAA